MAAGPPRRLIAHEPGSVRDAAARQAQTLLVEPGGRHLRGGREHWRRGGDGRWKAGSASLVGACPDGKQCNGGVCDALVGEGGDCRYVSCQPGYRCLVPGTCVKDAPYAWPLQIGPSMTRYGCPS